MWIDLKASATALPRTVVQSQASSIDGRWEGCARALQALLVTLAHMCVKNSLVFPGVMSLKEILMGRDSGTVSFNRLDGGYRYATCLAL